MWSLDNKNIDKCGLLISTWQDEEVQLVMQTDGPGPKAQAYVGGGGVE